jgi:hypothetical protein
MKLKACQKLHINFLEPEAEVNGLGGIIISTLIVGFALIIITIIASFTFIGKLFIK